MTTKWHWEIKWLYRNWLHPNGVMRRLTYGAIIPQDEMTAKARQVNGRLVKVTVTEEVVCGNLTDNVTK